MKKVSQKNAERLTFTEDTYLCNEAAMQVFEREAAVTEYEFVCTGDGETCDICRGLNGERFKIAERVPGLNFPPMHPWCRCFFDPVIPGKKMLTSGADGSIIGTTKNANGTEVEIVERTSLMRKPNSIAQKVSSKGGIERNYYNENGMQTKQIANNDRGKPKQHPFGKSGEHAHDYIYDSEGNLIGRPIRDLTDLEREENGNIL